MMAPHARRQLNGHRPYLGAHTKNSVIKKRGSDDDGCVRSDLDAIWPCSYVATLFGTPPVRVNSTMTRRSFALTKHWECPTCQVLAASDGENSDEKEDMHRMICLLKTFKGHYTSVKAVSLGKTKATISEEHYQGLEAESLVEICLLGFCKFKNA